MKVALVFGVTFLIVALDGVATAKLARSDKVTGRQEAAWVLLIWLVPLLGSLLAFQVATEKDIPAPAPTAREEGTQVTHLDGSGFL